MEIKVDNNEQNVEANYNINNRKKIYSFFKRLIDIIFSIVGLIVGMPFVALFGVLIKIEDKGPIFYKQERLGKDFRKIYVYKLRSMKMDAEKNGIAKWAEKNDPRITKVGRFIRKTRIDEIPQFINILNGEMSLVGPRPERPELTYEFDEQIPGFVKRLLVKPGLTGWAQVNGGYDMTPSEKLKWDMKYIYNRSTILDIKIILMTVRVILTGEGAR